jgi:cellulose synthase operon protein C
VRALGELYLRDRQFGEAAKRLERARGNIADPAAKLAVELDLAEIYVEQLGQKDEAERILTEVLRAEPRERRALRSYFQILSERRDPRAHEIAKRWADSADGTERTQAMTALARLLKDQGNTRESKEILFQALPGIGAGSGGPLLDLLNFLSGHDEGDLNQVVQGLEAHARTESFLAVERAESAFQAGRILLDRLGDLGRGRQALEFAIALDPSHVAARSHLITCLERAGDLGRALLEAQILVELDSLRVESWQELRRVLELTGRPAEAERTLGPLAILGGATEAERAAYRSRAPRAAQVVPGSAREGLTAMLDASFDQGAETLWLINELSSLGTKVFANGLELLGLAPKDKINPKFAHPLRPMVERVTKAFGIPEVDLYAIEANSPTPRLVFGDSLGLVIPMGFLSLRESEQVYLLGELLAGVALGVPLIFILNERDALTMIVAAGRTVDPSFLLPSVPPGPNLDELARRIARAPSWLNKGKFTERVRRYLEQAGSDPIALIRSVHRSSRAIALLLADDLAPLELLRNHPEVQERVGASELARVERELLSSWMSVRASRARAQMGL